MIANGGKLMTPRIVKSITTSDGKTVSTLKPIALRQVIAPQTATQIGTGLYRVTFPQDVSSCAYFAQIGDVGTGTGAAGVTRVRTSSISSSAVVVDTYPLGAGNGNPAAGDSSFHLFVAC